MSIEHRLLFALLPELIAAKRIDAVRRSLGKDSPVELHRLHLTLWVSLVFPSFPQELARRMQAVAATMAGERFFVTLNQLSHGPKCVVLKPEHPPEAARQLARHLRNQMTLLGDKSPRTGFNPHVTLLYTEKTSFFPPAQTIEPIQWYAKDFVLIHSIIGKHEHRELGRWPLHLPRQCVFPFDPEFIPGMTNPMTTRRR